MQIPRTLVIVDLGTVYDKLGRHSRNIVHYTCTYTGDAGLANCSLSELVVFESLFSFISGNAKQCLF